MTATRSRTPPALAPDLLDRLREQFTGFPLTRTWNLEIAALRPDFASMAMTPNEFTTNGSTGVVNGGVLATLADMACALALSTHFDGRMPFATADLHIRYLEPVDRALRVEATVVRVSPRSAVLECRILCGTHIVALATAQFSIKLRGKEAS